MIDRRTILATFSALAAIQFASLAHAAEKAPFDQAKFDAAMKSGAPVLVEVHAPWCPVCKKQTPILSELSAKPKFAKIARFEVDFDSQKSLLKTWNVQKQSTLIVFKSGKEVDRSTGVTDPAKLEELLAKAL